MVNPRMVTRAIKHKAQELGFSHVGIARAAALNTHASHLHQWIDSGYHGGMEYMARDTARRSDPDAVLPGARSVVVLACNYFSPEHHPPDQSNGKISRYAWGDDYHVVLAPLLEELETVIRTFSPEAATRRYVDTGPVMEKSWAVEAGIGWLGKHTNVITRDIGSWIFLGVILTTAELEYDGRIPDYCGDCTRCIDACPTEAIVAPYVLDARRCIPYLTIELKGEDIPGGEAMDFQNWIFGCDICQDVCPWNSFETPTQQTAFQPRPDVLNITLGDTVEMDLSRFNTLFRRSPVKRAKLGGLKRNARTVLRQRASNDTTNIKPA